MYFLSLLHQTTTTSNKRNELLKLYFFSLLHQTTTYIVSSFAYRSCISFLFYIKPQLRGEGIVAAGVVFPFSSTSNHNTRCEAMDGMQVVFPFSSTSNHNSIMIFILFRSVVFPFSSTSNHNQEEWRCEHVLLYFLSLLHQTTTSTRLTIFAHGCISFLFYIKPQHLSGESHRKECCISFLFYIKPQRD